MAGFLSARLSCVCMAGLLFMDVLLSLGLLLCPAWLEEPLGLVLALLAGCYY
jgi:hypothetical protein